MVVGFWGGIPRKNPGGPENRPLGVVQGVLQPPQTAPPPVLRPDQPMPRASNTVPLGTVTTINLVDPLRGVHSPPPLPQASPEQTDSAKKQFRALPKITVKWAGTFLDGSGYAEASRNYVAALSTVGVDVIGQNISFEEARADYGRAGLLSSETLTRTGDYAIKVIFLTPDHFPLFGEKNCYNIGLFDWETDVLPEEWVAACNSMDEIWVPCQWTAEVTRNSGVTKPIHVFGHCASPEDYSTASSLRFQDLDPSWYKFYSVFQWTERKNPRGLLKAYLTAFTDKDPVVLILKTYRSDYSEAEQGKVMDEIQQIKEEVGGDHQPRLLAILGMLSKEEILALHRLGDCFALIHRSEGWGLPHFEACMMGKPVITTGYSANMEFTRPEHSYLVGHGMTQVDNMPWIRWYRKNMVWSDPDIPQCRQYMKHVFKNRAEAKRKGELAKEFVVGNFSWRAVGTAMRARLEKILESL